VVLEPEGFYRLAYDPKFITGPPYQVSNKARLTRWKQIKCPIYLIHGNESKVLTPLVLKEMLKLQPTMKVCGIPEVGHTPSIMEAHQIETIRGWLAE
jgi:pimeloyl-ACP methyl ester carboxylesterase